MELKELIYRRKSTRSYTGEALDSAVAQLQALGVSQYEIIQHLKQGGDNNASNE